jgi:3-deoxy-manno-octulosonate cytidylyltransferase (CMP-KDO synthetase)
MNSVVVIPARYRSTRFPGKPLMPLLGKPMILWVAEIAADAVGADSVYVATDDWRISDTVREAGYKAVMTSEDAITGTDRVAEAAENISADIYVNVQGDEPLLDFRDIVRIMEKKQANMDCVINGYAWMFDKIAAESINVPKILTTEDSTMVYASRCVLPGCKDERNAPSKFKKQVCIYAYTKQELQEFRSFGRKSQLEFHEDIEILRFLELKKTVLMVETSAGSLAVDVPSDVQLVEDRLREK